MNKGLLKARNKYPALKRMICADCGHVKELYVSGEKCVACLLIPDWTKRTKPGIDDIEETDELFIHAHV